MGQVSAAKQVCLSCPVRSACLNWAIGHRQEHGIWGGTTEAERRALRSVQVVRQRRPA